MFQFSCFFMNFSSFKPNTGLKDEKLYRFKVDAFFETQCRNVTKRIE